LAVHLLVLVADFLVAAAESSVVVLVAAAESSAAVLAHLIADVAHSLSHAHRQSLVVLQTVRSAKRYGFHLAKQSKFA
jgi:hypothetical protein